MKSVTAILPKLALLPALLAAPGLAHAQSGEDWEWMVEPYAWAATVGTDMRTLRPPTEAENETSFFDIVDKLDGAFQMRIEGRGDAVGVFADFTYLGIADDAHRRVMATRTDLDTRLFDAAVSFRLDRDHEAGWDVYAGVRYIDVDLTVRLRPDNPAFAGRTLDGSRDYTDLLLGTRKTWAFSGGRWGMTLRGDASVGDTDGSWSAALMGHYRTGHGMWLFGYRHLEVELGSDNMDTTITLSGPQVGYGFRF